MNERKGEKSFCEKYLEKFDFIKSETIAELLNNGFDSFHSLLALDLSLDLDKLTDISLGQRSLLRKTLVSLKQNFENSFCSTIDKSFNDLVINEKSFSLKREREDGEQEERARQTSERIVEIDIDSQSNDHVIDPIHPIHHATISTTLQTEQLSEKEEKPIKQELTENPDKKLLNKLLAQNSDKIQFKEIEENDKEFNEKFRQIFFNNFCTKFVFCEICRKILTKNRNYLKKHLKNDCKQKSLKTKKLSEKEMRKKCFIGVKKLVFDFDQKHNEYSFEGIVVKNYETIVGKKQDQRVDRRNHSNHNDYKCEFCSFRTKYPFSLDQHKVKHMNAHNNADERKTFGCDACAYTCHTHQMLESHMSAVHVDDLSESIVGSESSDAKYCCQAHDCSFGSVWKLKVKKHMLNVHNKEFNNSLNEMKENDIKDKVKHKIQKLIFS